LKTIYSLVWDDFCSWYLEWIKPGFEQPVDAGIYKKTVEFFTELMQLLHPFMPFVTEEIYHQLKERPDDICVKQFEKAKATDQDILSQGELLKQIITSIRDIRNKNNIKPKEAIQLHIHSHDEKGYAGIESILSKQVNAQFISYVSDAVSNTLSAVIGRDKFYIETKQELNTGSQKEQLIKDLEYLKGFLISVDKKLSNERFVQNAKAEVIEIERKKKADAEEKIKAIEESLAQIK